MEIYGHVWTCTEMYGNVWTRMEMDGHVRKFWQNNAWCSFKNVFKMENGWSSSALPRSNFLPRLGYFRESNRQRTIIQDRIFEGRKDGQISYKIKEDIHN